jgi:hypothetical protein
MLFHCFDTLKAKSEQICSSSNDSDLNLEDAVLNLDWDSSYPHSFPMPLPESFEIVNQIRQ